MAASSGFVVSVSYSFSDPKGHTVNFSRLDSGPKIPISFSSPLDKRRFRTLLESTFLKLQHSSGDEKLRSSERAFSTLHPCAREPNEENSMPRRNNMIALTNKLRALASGRSDEKVGQLGPLREFRTLAFSKMWRIGCTKVVRDRAWKRGRHITAEIPMWRAARVDPIRNPAFMPDRT